MRKTGFAYDWDDLANAIVETLLRIRERSLKLALPPMQRLGGSGLALRKRIEAAKVFGRALSKR